MVRITEHLELGGLLCCNVTLIDVDNIQYIYIDIDMLTEIERDNRHDLSTSYPAIVSFSK